MDQHPTSSWTEKDGCLYKCFRFAGFSEAFGFMTQVALLAEQLDHHPRWTNVYNKVEFWLLTHSAGNKITDKDRNMAERIDLLLQ